ncbi:unnamed protein product [Meganyctiphanes norvegica]|uniref:Uncharacterized protein n=1 Tax=Meganyctiphanes norvegica TaxID=48144 RepID=A0AAV2R360_MEGNR
MLTIKCLIKKKNNFKSIYSYLKYIEMSPAPLSKIPVILGQKWLLGTQIGVETMKGRNFFIFLVAKSVLYRTILFFGSRTNVIGNLNQLIAKSARKGLRG